MICSCGSYHYEDTAIHALSWPMRLLRLQVKEAEVLANAPPNTERRTIHWPETGKLPVPKLCGDCWEPVTEKQSFNIDSRCTVAIREGDSLLAHRRPLVYGVALATACGKTFDELSLANFQE